MAIREYILLEYLYRFIDDPVVVMVYALVIDRGFVMNSVLIEVDVDVGVILLLLG